MSENKKDQELEKVEESSTVEGPGTLANNAEDIAAGMFSLYLPKFKQAVETLSSRQLRRLLKMLVEYPLNEREYQPKNQVEKNAFLVGNKLLEAKFMMILTTHFDLAEKPNKKKEGKKDGETNS